MRRGGVGAGVQRFALRDVEAQVEVGQYNHTAGAGAQAWLEHICLSTCIHNGGRGGADSRGGH